MILLRNYFFDKKQYKRSWLVIWAYSFMMSVVITGRRNMFGNLAFFWRLEKRTDSLARIIAHRFATEDNYPPNNKNWRDVFWDD